MTTQLQIKDFLKQFESDVPTHLAYDWDNVGLQIGDSSIPLKGIMTTLDINEAVIDEAIALGANLIISHHPIMFKPMKRIDASTTRGKIVKKCFLNDIVIYSAHTNYDRLEGGMNDQLARRLHLTNIDTLVTESTLKRVKLLVYVPLTHKQALDEALIASGIGTLGSYEACMFETLGRSNFLPTEKAHPFIGSINVRESVEEVKLAYLIDEDQIALACNIIKEFHPYESPAYDLVPLLNEGQVQGIGRIGDLPKPVTFESFVQQVKATFNLEGVRVVGQDSKIIKRVAVLGGSGEKFSFDAIDKKADVYITGDVTFHPAQDAEQLGLNIIDAGHYLEAVMKEDVQSICREILMRINRDIIVDISSINTNPFSYR
ncbi:GTP cyclohydrolase 1 type 2 [Halolactibacillus alkaliphilus]|uniref:GTP cyclohydrolase 1 type 2 homolog n=1 Tax=Halolactibacillus alkaliphilus TaxID=442899 RepID=A0A511X399_9BACI|nr:Nif3-like dinuclear metal center hexameric protein [Halolactibacillus alkaliphilus]GEN57401.1 GTP cyclohydrolase 1 type 2 [Halolactibacillus alkaliphilus]GGN69079.1 GTP cyclohydrolase 1 type 2 [Halolactibacillus alkaliphilus]SFO73652.1 dinuclear metal center protein, YbgI/SA1388 family [Halolactibacillus alkaliphilus]